MQKRVRKQSLTNYYFILNYIHQMLQDRRFVGSDAITNANIKPYSVGALSTPNSPSHISMAANYLNMASSPTNVNAYHIQTTLPQSVISKPISVTIMPSTRQVTQIQHTSTRIVSQPAQNIRAIGSNSVAQVGGNTTFQQINQVQQIQQGYSSQPPLSTGVQQLQSSVQSQINNQSQLYKRIATQQQQKQNVTSNRYNNRFYGSGIPDNSKSRSRSISPIDGSRSIGISGVGQQIDGQTHQYRQSRSSSPVMVNTTGLTQSQQTQQQRYSGSPGKNQINFMYASQGSQGYDYRNQTSQNSQQSAGHQQILQHIQPQPHLQLQPQTQTQVQFGQVYVSSPPSQLQTRQQSPQSIQPQTQARPQVQFNTQYGQSIQQQGQQQVSINQVQQSVSQGQAQNQTHVQAGDQNMQAQIRQSAKQSEIGQTQTGQVTQFSQGQSGSVSQGVQQVQNRQIQQGQQAQWSGAQQQGQAQFTHVQTSQQANTNKLTELNQQTSQNQQIAQGQFAEQAQRTQFVQQGQQVQQQGGQQEQLNQGYQGQMIVGQQGQLAQDQRQILMPGQQFIHNQQFAQHPQYPQQPQVTYHQYQTTRIVQPMVPIAPPPPIAGIHSHFVPHSQMQQFQQHLYDPNSNQIVQVDNRTLITTTTIIWEHRFIEIYSKFQTFVERFQAIVDEIYYIDDLFENVSDEEAWNDLRTKYSDMIDKFNEMREEIILVLEQNKAAVNSLSPQVIQELEQKQMIEQERQENQQEEGQEPQENQRRERHQQEEQQQGRGEEGGQTGKSGSDNNHIWQNRYLQLMQQHQQLAQENGQLGHQVEKLRAMLQQMQEHMESDGDAGDHKKPRVSEHENLKVIELQRNLNTVHSEYQKLQDNYTKLSDEYSKAVRELQNIGSGENQGIQNQISQLHQQLEMAEAKIQQLYQQSQIKDEHIANMQKEMQQYAHIFEENKHLNQTLVQMQQSLQSYDTELKNKDKVLKQFDTQNKSLHEQFNKLSKSLQQFENQNSQNNQNPQQNQELQKSLKQLENAKKQLQYLKQQEKNLLNVIEKHQQSIQQMGSKYQQLSRQYEGTVKQKEDQIKLLNKFLEQERQAKEKAIRQNSTVETTKNQSISQSKIFKQRLQIQIEEIVAEKNRKIKSLTQDLEDLKSRIETIEKDKQKSIKQIKDYFQEEEEKYIKKVQDKDNNLKLLNQKIRSFENQLSNRNLQISRFRHQSPVNSFSSVNEQSKKYSEVIEKKNYQMQQLRRTIQQKSINIKQLEQKIFSLQQEINGKVFEINSLKRQTYDSHGHRAELDNLNNVIKKKNQQLNELRLTGLELDQLRLNIDSLERQKIRLNEYLKQKTRECESKDATIQSLQRKVTSMSFENIGASRKKSTDLDRNATAVSINNYETLLRQRQNQLKNTKYELDMLETKTQISEKTIRDLNNKINSIQRSASVLKAQMQNKIAKYQNQIKDLNKQIRNLKANKQQLANTIESLQSKNHSLEKALDQRNSLFDKEVNVGKNKISNIEKYNTSLLTDKQILKNENDRLIKDNKQLNDKINSLQDKIQSKNAAINQIKVNFQKKQKQGTKAYEQKIKRLDGDLKLSLVRVKKMQEQIQILNRKIASAESEKRSYKQRLITEHNSNDKQEFIDFRYASEHYDDHQDHIEFRLKDPQSNDVFERKVIYDLKRENDFLRKELSGMGGYNSYSMNRIDTQHNRFSNYEQEAFTERDRFRQGKFDDNHNDQLLNYHKNKNKQLESRIDELLKVNNQLKQRIAILNAGANNQMSIQFYKDQVTRLQSDVAKLQARIKQILSEHETTRDQITGHEHMVQSIKDKVREQESKITQLKNIIRQKQETIVHLENSKSICQQEIERLKSMLEKGQKDKDQLSKKDKSLNQSSKRQRSLEQQIAKLTNKNSIQAAEIERLNEVLKIKKNELDNRFGQSSEQAKKLKKRILDLQRQLQLLKLEHSSQISSSGDLEYKLELIRSFFVEIEVLIGQIPLQDKRAQSLTQQVRNEIKEGLNAVASISV